MEYPSSNFESPQFDSVSIALEALEAGQAVVVVDDENREYEGKLIASYLATKAEKLGHFLLQRCYFLPPRRCL